MPRSKLTGNVHPRSGPHGIDPGGYEKSIFVGVL